MRAYITRRCGCTDSAFYTRTCTRPLTKEPLVLFLTEIYGPITPKADYNECEYFFCSFFPPPVAWFYMCVESNVSNFFPCFVHLPRIAHSLSNALITIRDFFFFLFKINIFMNKLLELLHFSPI